uniref:Carbonic anhydrase n=1 Tax=Daphnia galeata TaxID=27404 RepID=A0A8J2RCQ0_9CRUS|nr:unnamed protein product [Daphnia galeata]
MVWTIGDWCICVPESIELLSQSVQKFCGCGPHSYTAKHFLHAPGHRQSPINIRPDEVKLDPRLNIKRLTWNYPKETTELLNTGYCWKAHVPTEGATLSGGPLSHEYQLAQYHCHWGENDQIGSEHVVNGQAYGAEIHFVNWNTKYGSFNEALKYGDGLAVLGVFLKVGKENPELNKLCELTNEVKHKDECAAFRNTLDPNKLLPERGAYYTYLGSLTTPPCNECVIWIVFVEPVEVSHEQLESFREMMSMKKGGCSQPSREHKILNNFRPPLSVEERVVSLGYL